MSKSFFAENAIVDASSYESYKSTFNRGTNVGEDKSLFTESASTGRMNSQRGRRSNSGDSEFNEKVKNIVADIQNTTGINLMLEAAELAKNKGNLRTTYFDALTEDIEPDVNKHFKFDDNAGDFHMNLSENAKNILERYADTVLTESASVGAFQPIVNILYPILVKNTIKEIGNKIIDVEVTNTPIIKRQVETFFLVDKSNATATTPPIKYEFPKCLYDTSLPLGAWADGGLGDDLSQTFTGANFPVERVDISTASDGEVEMRFTITDVTPNGTTWYPVHMSFDISNNGVILNGYVKKVDAAGAVVVDDQLIGAMNYADGTLTVHSVGGPKPITGIKVKGRVSTEFNRKGFDLEIERTTMEWKAERSLRMIVPMGMDEIEDAKALLNIDLYVTYINRIGEIISAYEDQSIIYNYLNHFSSYVGNANFDALNLDPFVQLVKYDFNDATTASAVPPAVFHMAQLKDAVFKLITALSDLPKVEDFQYIVFCNPRYARVLDQSVTWVVTPNDTLNGIKLTYSQGILNNGSGQSVRIVSSPRIPVHDPSDPTKRYIYVAAVSGSDERITFKRFLYSKHLHTAANSQYVDPTTPGGAKDILTAYSRYVDVMLQGIMGAVRLDNFDDAVSVIP